VCTDVKYWRKDMLRFTSILHICTHTRLS